MKLIKKINPFWAFIAIILGSTLFKHFDFGSNKFKDPYFDVIYLVVFIVSMSFLIIEFKKENKKNV